MTNRDEARIRGEVASEFVQGLQQEGCTQVFNFLFNSAQFDKAVDQGMYLDVVAARHGLPQLPEEVRAGFSYGQVGQTRAVYFAFDGIHPGQTRVAALIKPLGHPLQSDLLTFSAKDANETDRVMAQIASRLQGRRAVAPA